MKKKTLYLLLLVFCICITCSGCKANKAQVEQPEDVAEPVVAEDVTEIEEVETVEQLFEELNVSMWASSGVNVRSEYSKDSEKIGKLSTGDKITVTGNGINKAKNWYRIEFKGKTGYVKKTYLSDTKKNKPAKGDDKAISTVDKTTTNNSGGNKNTGNKKPSNTGNSSGTITSGGGTTHGDAPTDGRDQYAGTFDGTGGSAYVDPDMDTSGWH